MFKEYFNINSKLVELSNMVELNCRDMFYEAERTAENNQLKVIKAMQEHNIGEMHFQGTTGYGYDDAGREAIESIYSKIFNTEDSLVRTQFVSGTHALNVALWSILRPGDIMLAVTGKPYDSLEEAIGIVGKGQGSLKDFGIVYEEISLLENGGIDYDKIHETLTKKKVKVVHIQRSRGYAWRPSFNVESIKKLIHYIKSIDKNVICMVDNCYGEFVEEQEPTSVGADLTVGSLIKNPGGGLAKTGAYITGRKDIVELAGYRLTAPGVGKEYGATLGNNRDILMGLFLAPYVVSQSIKGAVFGSALMKELGYDVSPTLDEGRTDIIQSIRFNQPESLIAFCQGIQKGAAVDSHVTPEPSDMPGYSNKVIMAAGTFIQGASIEMSTDAPIRPPYIAYMQGGLTYTHAKLGILMGVQELINRGLLELMH